MGARRHTHLLIGTFGGVLTVALCLLSTSALGAGASFRFVAIA